MIVRRILIRGGMKKKVVLIGLVAVCIVLGVLCYKTWFIAFFITKFLSGRRDGKQGIVRSIVIPWRSYRLHLHHWLLALVLGGVFMVKGFYVVTPEIFYGFLSAAIFQGIYCYRDWYQIIRKKERAAASGALAAMSAALLQPSIGSGHVLAPGTELSRECCI